MHKIILHKNAAKYYKNADKKLQGRINTAIETILGNPHYHVHIKKLEGELEGYVSLQTRQPEDPL